MEEKIFRLHGTGTQRPQFFVVSLPREHAQMNDSLELCSQIHEVYDSIEIQKKGNSIGQKIHHFENC